jgi:hypothetical protein
MIKAKRKRIPKLLPQINNSLCPRCGIAFHCGAKAGKNECWCFNEAQARERDPNATDCLCKECLTKPINKWFGWYVWGGILVFCLVSWYVTMLLLSKLFH